MKNEYAFRAKILNVVDGDTIDAELDVGFSIKTVQRFRLLGIDTPEVRGSERLDGMISKYAVENILMGRGLKKTRDKIIELSGSLEKAIELIDPAVKPVSELVSRTRPVVTIRSTKTGKFGRWLGEIFIEGRDGEPVNVNEWLIKNNLAKRYVS